VFSTFYSLERYLAAISTEDINFASCIIKIKAEFCPCVQYRERLGHIVNTVVVMILSTARWRADVGRRRGGTEE
jgi:hypothetical protein